jgi:hypothetical protein
MTGLRRILMSAAVALTLVAGPVGARPDEGGRGTDGGWHAFAASRNRGTRPPGRMLSQRRESMPPGAPGERRLVIRPDADGDWDGASLADVTKVLTSAAETLWEQVPERRLAPIHVEPKGGPIVLYQRGPGGAYRVRLDTGSTYWCQYAFQFAHEFCHILCRYEETEKANKWFEESVCEAASLFALRRMAEVWKNSWAMVWTTCSTNSPREILRLVIT